MPSPTPPPNPVANPPGTSNSTDAAAIDHYENFPVASWLCPPHLRSPIAAIYHFARTADDIADEGPANPAERLAELADYRAQISLCTDTMQPLDPRWAGVFAALGKALRTHDLPVQLLHDLLDAFVQDVHKTRDREGYADDAELNDYCRRSANPVGRLLLHLYGVVDATALRQSDAICTALQLINFWQDPSVDIPRGRFYFTQAAQSAHGVTQADLLAQRQTPAVTRMVAQCVHDARTLMLQGAPLVHAVPGRAGWELRLVVQGGLRILDKIEALQYATLQTRPTLKKYDYLVMLWRTLWM